MIIVRPRCSTISPVEGIPLVPIEAAKLKRKDLRMLGMLLKWPPLLGYDSDLTNL
ncbi:hypothetical protein PAENIP36_41140 [Paenibacillus sp. P36]